jgi:hypothetical protein
MRMTCLLWTPKPPHPPPPGTYEKWVENTCGCVKSLEFEKVTVELKKDLP